MFALRRSLSTSVKRLAASEATEGARLTPGYKPARNGGYTSYTGVVPDTEPIPKIQAMHRRLQRILAEMPEDYPYRVTMTSVLDAEAAKVAQFASDLDALEQALGHSHIEMYIRQLKMELRCARSLADDQPWGELFAPAPQDQWKWPVV